MMFVEGLREKARVGFDTWLQQETDSERICCVTGPLGSGKTTLAAEFCGVEPDGEGTRDVKKQRRQGEEEAPLITAFYFFQGDENLALNKCWAKVGRQLAGRLGYDLVCDVSTEEDSLFVFRRFVAEPLTRLSKPSNKIVILVDGVDKLPWEEQESFWEIVSQTWERETPMWVHLAVFSYTALRLSGAIRWIDLQDEDHEKDIELLCNARLASFMQDEEDVQYATKHIVRHTTERPSVLLYTSCVLDALLEGRSHRSVTLDDIWEMEWRPDCLAHAFRPYLIHFLDHVMDGDIDRYHQLLSCLSAARTPLSIDVAAEALEMNKESLKALVSRSTSLVYQEGDVIKFAHPCLKDFVQHRRCGNHPDGSPLQVKARRGHEWFVHFLEHNKTSSLALHDLIYHLCCARKWDAVRDHLLDFDWVLALVSEEGCALKLIEDADKLYNDKPHADVNATDVVRAIDLGLEAILADSALLKQQIIGRIPDKTHPIRRSYEASLFAQTERAKRVFLPVGPTLLPARSSFRKRLRFDFEALRIGCTDMDGRFVDILCNFTHESSISRMWDSKLDQVFTFPLPIGELLRGFVVTHGHDGRCHDWRFDKLLLDPRKDVDAGYVLNEFNSRAALGDGVLALACARGESFVDIDGSEGWTATTKVWVFDLDQKLCLHSLELSLANVNALAIEGDICLISGREWPSNEGVGMLVSYRTGAQICKVNLDMARTKVSLSRELAYFDGDPHHRVWNLRSGQVETTLHPEAHHVDLVNGLYVIDGQIKDVATGSTVGFTEDSIIAFLGPYFVSAWRECYPLSVSYVHFPHESFSRTLGCSADSWNSLNHLAPFGAESFVRYMDHKYILSHVALVAVLWDAETIKPTQVFDCSVNIRGLKNPSRQARILYACMDHDCVVCTTVVYGLHDYYDVHVWSKSDGKCLHTWKIAQWGLNDVRVFSNCVMVLYDSEVVQHDLQTGRKTAQWRLPLCLVTGVLSAGDLVFGSIFKEAAHVIVSYKTGDVLFRQKGFGTIDENWDLVSTERKVADRDEIYVVNWRNGQQVFQLQLTEGLLNLELPSEKLLIFRREGERGMLRALDMLTGDSLLLASCDFDSTLPSKVCHGTSVTTVAFGDERGNINIFRCKSI